MKTRFFPWVLALLLSIGIPVDPVALQSHIDFAAEEESSSERQNETFKASVSRKRNAGGRKAKTSYPPSRVTLAYAPDTFVGQHPLTTPPAPLSHQQLHQLHQVFRI